MDCPCCGVFRLQKEWSKCQWNALDGLGCPFATAGDGWPRNCCRLCSDSCGEYYTKRIPTCDTAFHVHVNKLIDSYIPSRNSTSGPPRPSILPLPEEHSAGYAPQKHVPPPRASPVSPFIPAPPAPRPDNCASAKRPPPTPPTRAKPPPTTTHYSASVIIGTPFPQSGHISLRTESINNIRNWLQKNISSKFWIDSYHWVIEMNITCREEMKDLNRRMGFSERKSFLKHLSHNGAVRLPKWAPENWSCWKCEAEQQSYIDVSNQIYLEVMRSCWPEALESLQMTDKETVGDLVEAILGAHYILRVRQGWEFDFIVEDFIVMLERLCICTYVQSVMP